MRYFHTLQVPKTKIYHLQIFWAIDKRDRNENVRKGLIAKFWAIFQTGVLFWDTRYLTDELLVILKLFRQRKFWQKFVTQLLRFFASTSLIKSILDKFFELLSRSVRLLTWWRCVLSGNRVKQNLECCKLFIFQQLFVVCKESSQN